MKANEYSMHINKTLHNAHMPYFVVFLFDNTWEQVIFDNKINWKEICITKLWQ